MGCDVRALDSETREMVLQVSECGQLLALKCPCARKVALTVTLMVGTLVLQMVPLMASGGAVDHRAVSPSVLQCNIPNCNFRVTEAPSKVRN